jgi:hypothetical protein
MPHAWLRMRSYSLTSEAFLNENLSLLEHTDLAGCLAVVDENKVRIRH